MDSMRRRVLIVEPDNAQQKTYLAVLKPDENGWELAFASSAMQAMDLNREHPFDIVVTGNRLPDQSGIGLFEILRETNPETIRFLLIDESEKNVLRSLVSSAQQVIAKPIQLKPFVAQINRALALRELVRDPAILKLLGEDNELPPLPRVFQELSRLLADPNASLHDVAEVLSQDIVLSSKVLKLANSALFSLRQPARNVAQAVSLLGSSAISSLVFSQGMYDTFRSDAANEAFFEELNRHSIECAALTSRILASWNTGSQLIEKSLFCGIAHDLGKLVLAQYAPEKWRQIQTELQKREKSDVELERTIIGITHADLAAYLLAVWGFPNDQIIAIAFHHEPSRINEPSFGLLCALHIAEVCCTPESTDESFDWDYLAANRIGEDDIAVFRSMLAEAEGAE